MSVELEAEVNRWVVWDRVNLFLNSSDIMTARVMLHWKTLFGLKCEDRDSYLSFCLSSRGILHELKTSKYVPVTYNIFLKAYFRKMTACPEPQSKVKSCLTNPASS